MALAFEGPAKGKEGMDGYSEKDLVGERSGLYNLTRRNVPVACQAF
jgi:hypothetical protein